MTEITADDEREARKWLNDATAYPTPPGVENRHRATILALLDRRTMPRPEDVPDEALLRMQRAYLTEPPHSRELWRNIYRALYDHYNPKPKPKKPWAVISNNVIVDWCAAQADAERIGLRHPGSRIVRLVEADSHD